MEEKQIPITRKTDLLWYTHILKYDIATTETNYNSQNNY